MRFSSRSVIRSSRKVKWLYCGCEEGGGHTHSDFTQREIPEADVDSANYSSTEGRGDSGEANVDRESVTDDK